MNHEHDENGNCIIPDPEWRFSLWDVAGIGISTVSAMATMVGQGLNLMAREFNAMANWERSRKDAEEAWAEEQAAREEMSERLESLTGMDTYWVGEVDESESPVGRWQDLGYAGLDEEEGEGS